MDEGSVARVRDAWRRVLGAPAAFRGPGTVVVTRPARPAPGPRWVTVVTLGDSRCVLIPADLAADLNLVAGPAEGRDVAAGRDVAEGRDVAAGRGAAATAPGARDLTAGQRPASARDPAGAGDPAAERDPARGLGAAAGPNPGANHAAGGLDAGTAARLADPAEARGILGPGIGVLGPAMLAFTATGAASPVPSPAEPVEPGAPDLDQLGAACDPADAAESALAAWTHWVHVIRERDLVVAAAGAQVWAGTLAHLGVLTRPDRRRRGLGATVASSVVRAALAAGLVAQWRARRELTASRRLAAGLGFVELGEQVSYELPGAPGDRRR
jgi:hypothetical protein